MNNLQSALFNYLDWLVDPLVRSLEPATRDAYAELIWRAVAAWDDGFIAGPRDTRANVATATATAGTTPDRMQRLLDLGLVEVIDGAVFVQRGLDLLADQDTRRHRGSRGGKAPRKSRPKPSQLKSTQVQFSQPESTQVNSSELDGTRTGQDRTGQDRTEDRSLTLSSSYSQRHPALAREEAGRRESDSDFWGPKIEAVYTAIHGQAPQAGSREAIAAALRTTRATDLVLAIEGAKRNKWAQQDRRRQTLPGILSPKRRDGHIQDARSFYAWTGDQGETWAEGMMRSHGGDK